MARSSRRAITAAAGAWCRSGAAASPEVGWLAEAVSPSPRAEALGEAVSPEVADCPAAEQLEAGWAADQRPRCRRAADAQATRRSAPRRATREPRWATSHPSPAAP